MDKTEIILAVIAGVFGLFGTGSVGYLLFEKLTTHRRDKADTKGKVISNSNEVADLYSKIHEIVCSETNPLREKIDMLDRKLSILGCWRYGCHERLHSAQDITQEAKEAWKTEYTDIFKK